MSLKYLGFKYLTASPFSERANHSYGNAFVFKMKAGVYAYV